MVKLNHFVKAEGYIFIVTFLLREKRESRAISMVVIADNVEQASQKAQEWVLEQYPSKKEEDIERVSVQTQMVII